MSQEEINRLQDEVAFLKAELQLSLEGREELVKEVRLALTGSHEAAMSQLANSFQQSFQMIQQSHAQEIERMKEIIDLLKEKGGSQQMVSDEYTLLLNRFRKVMFEHEYSPEINLEKFYEKIFSFRYRKMLSPHQLNILLSKDERLRHTVSPEVSQTGFFEEICSRLPKLQFCSMEGYRRTFNLKELENISSPFPELVELNARFTLLTNEDLLMLIQHIPHLRELDVTCCISITWEGVVAAREYAKKIGRVDFVILPEEEEVFDRELEAICTVEMLLNPKSTVHKLVLTKLNEQYKESIGPSELPPEEKLWALWKSLGGVDHIYENINLIHLQIMLLNFQCHTVAFRVGNTSDLDVPATTIPVGEIRGFISILMSRVARLRNMTIVDCPLWPFDTQTIMEADTPFVEIKTVRIYSTPCTTRDLIELCQLGEFSLVVDWQRVQGSKEMSDDDKMELLRQCNGKLSFRE